MATSPVVPSLMLPGVCANVSQMDGPRPSSWTAPSIWYAEVAVPHRKPSGNDRGRGAVMGGFLGGVLLSSPLGGEGWGVRGGPAERKQRKRKIKSKSRKRS